MNLQNENPQIESAKIIADALYELAEQTERTSPNSYSSMSGNSLTDSVALIAFQLERIADVLEKQNKNK